MSFNQRYYEWQRECLRMIKLKRSEKKKKLQMIGVAVICELEKIHKRQYTKKHLIAPVLENKNFHGFYRTIFPNIILEDSEFRNYFRMTATQLEDLLQIVGPSLSKETSFYDPLSASERLRLTLRYLAAGDSMKSISCQYLISATTVSNIIKETCNVIWTCMQEEVLPSTLSKDDWLHIASEFENKWNFPHCIGAIDGKHIVIQCPDNADSSYYNYKNSHNIVLLAICNANYMFTFVEIGAYGRCSDGSIFRSSLMGQKFTNEEMNLPEPQSVTDGISLPYVLVGDEAFPLTKYLVRPYPGKHLNQERKIYNYRLNRARKIIESTFRVLSSQWRILRCPIDTTVDTCIKIVQAIICLHNWLRIEDIGNDEYILPSVVEQDNSHCVDSGSSRLNVIERALRDISHCGSNIGSQKAILIRDTFCHYFNSKGAVPWQVEYC